MSYFESKKFTKDLESILCLQKAICYLWQVRIVMVTPRFDSFLIMAVALISGYLLVNLVQIVSADISNTSKLVNYVKISKNNQFVNVIVARDSSFPDNKNFFMPSNLTIEGNTTVIWTNNDTVLHTVTSGNPVDSCFSALD